LVIRNFIILLIDLIFGALIGLELKFSLLGQLFIEPYRSLMPAGWGILFLLWLLVQIPVVKKAVWPALGAIIGLAVAAIIPLWENLPAIHLETIFGPALSLIFILLATVFVSLPLERAEALSNYLPVLRSKRIIIHSPAGPFWLLFSIALGIIGGVTLYHHWIPSAFLIFVSSPELFRLIFYVLFASLSGYLTLSPGWGAFSVALFVFSTEFTFQFLYTAYASLREMVWEFAGIFLDPARVIAPLAFIVVSFLWGWASGRYARNRQALKEARLEAQVEKGPEAPPPSQENLQIEAPNPPSLKNCPSCGASIDPEAVFCPKCGFKQEG
jgi:hypothetical protein